ncbi:MAG: redoxin domain-containing protein [Steroidobacteraceae bacterium]
MLMFYRGGWCPYCNRNLAELRFAEPELKRMDFEVLFLSASLKEPRADYTLLSDSRMAAASAFGIAFRVDDATIARYKDFGIDLEAASGETHHQLPVPAVLIVDTRGIIRFSYANPDYRIRLKSAELLDVASRLFSPPARFSD